MKLKQICITMSIVIALCFSVGCKGENNGVNSATAPTVNVTENPNGNASNNEEIKAGEYITFGKYEQDNNLDNGSENIEWLVLKVENNEALVISKDALDCIPYNDEYIDITWENSNVREWLNNDFYNKAFSDDEKNIINTTNVAADKNGTHNTEPGISTKDKIFLLSSLEASEYFESNEQRQCKPTQYALSKNVYVGINGNCFWWLRTPGSTQNAASSVYVDGIINETGYMVNHGNNTVRPAMWIQI